MSRLARLGKVARLTGLRLVALALMLLQNVLIARYLSLAEIGEYYLLTTVAYLGNALVFVGADLYLQRQLARLSQDRALGRRAVRSFLLVTAAVGAACVLVAALGYFAYRGAPHWQNAVWVCCALSVATYLSGLGRNLLQLAAEPVYANLGAIAEGALRAGVIMALVGVGEATALHVAAVSALGSLLAAAVAGALLLHVTHDHGIRYLQGIRSLATTVVPVGGSALLNWLQLQGYRPAVAQFTGSTQLVGTVAFMSTLGSTAANAVFGILGQLQVPRQYESRGATTPKYLYAVLATAGALAVLSLPAGWAFLWLSKRAELLPLVYLVALGVLLEAGNAAVGVCTNHANARGQTLWGLPACSLAGCAVTYAVLLAVPQGATSALGVAASLVAGQAVTVTAILFLTFKTVRANHAER